MISMNFPSRGLRESATTIRNIGDFLRPVRRRRIRTAMVLCSSIKVSGDWWLVNQPPLLQGSSRTGQLPVAPWSCELPHAEHVRPELTTAARHGSGFLHHLLHLAELLEQAIHLAHRSPGSARDACAARAVHDARI